MARIKILFLLFCLFFCWIDGARAGPQTPTKSVTENAQQKTRGIYVDSTLVAVNVSVTDPLNRLVTGLNKTNFQVFEDGIEQNVIHFSSEDTPVIVGFVLDISGSMGEKLKKSREAVTQFLKTTNPEDQFFLIKFSDQPYFSVELTKDQDKIQTNLLLAQSKGRTALLDAIYMAINYGRQIKDTRKALMIISDGGDNHSRYVESDVVSLVREADVQVYAIGVLEPLGARNRTPEEMSGPELLTKIAESTGGRLFVAENVNDLPDIAKKIGLELRSQYVLHYKPNNENKDGKYRRIRVKLTLPRGYPSLGVHYRLGYYSPLY